MSVEVFPAEITDRATLERCMAVHGPLTLARQNYYAKARYWCGISKVSRDLVGKLCRAHILKVQFVNDVKDVSAVLTLAEQPPLPDPPPGAV